MPGAPAWLNDQVAQPSPYGLQDGWTPPARNLFLPIRPVSFGSLFASGFREFRQNLRGLAALALVWEGIFTFIGLLGPVAAVFFVLIPALQQDTNPNDPGGINQGLSTFFAVMVVSFAFVLPFAGLMLGQIFVQAGASADIANATIDRHLTFREMARHIRPRIGALLGWVGLVVVVSTMCLTGLVALEVFSTTVLGRFTRDADQTVPYLLAFLANVLVVLGSTLVFGALATKVSLVPSIIVMERLGPFRAIARSWRLTRGNFWRYLGTTLLVSFAVNFAVQMISSIVTFIAMIGASIVFSLGDSHDGGVQVIIGIIIAVLSALALVVFHAATTIVMASTFATMYLDARIRAEGLDQAMQRWVDTRAAGRDPGPTPFESAASLTTPAQGGWATR